MKIYRLHVRENQAGSVGYTFFTSKGAAEKAKRDAEQGINVAAVRIDGPYGIELTKTGVLAALNHYASHPDNG